MTVGTGAPYLYDYLNTYNSLVEPSTTHSSDANLTRFFTRYLFQRAISVFKHKFPPWWQKNYVLYTLYLWGFFTVIKTDKFGVIPQGCSLKGYGVQYQPTNCVIANPLLAGIKEPLIGKECELVKLQPDYGGIYDIVSFYADMMSLTATTAGINIVNSKLGYVFMAENKSSAESFKKMFDSLSSGEAATVVGKNMFSVDGKPLWVTFATNLKQNYIAGDLLEDLRSWEKRFDAEIGIPTTNTEKRERLVADEVNANSVESKTRADMWLEELKSCYKKVNEMFGLDLAVEWRERGLEDATRDADSNGGV